MTFKRQMFGQSGEDLAAKHLSQKGFRILNRNYRNQIGEIDLIALDGDELVFVEVKTRKNSDFGFPEESVTSSKLRKIIRISQLYLQEKKAENRPHRIDVVAILQDGSKTEINHLEAVDVDQNL